MNKFLKGFIVAASIIVVSGCSSVLNNNEGVFGKSQAAVQKVDQKVQVIDTQESKMKDDKLSHIGAFAKGGVEYALDKITNNPPKEVAVAKQMNERVEALADQPDFTEVKGIEGIVDELTSQNQIIRDEGKAALEAKDKQIGDLQNQYKQLEDTKAKEVSIAFQQANEIAKTADQYKATLSKMDSFFGLGAVWYGAHKFVITSLWVLGIGLILFIILRILSGANPIASAIFGIFEQAVSCVIHAISFIFPKALSLAGQVSSEIYNGTKSALTSIVDSVETVKLQGNAAGTPPTIQDLLNTAELSMTPADKALIEKIKLELGWIKPSVVPTVAPITGSIQTTPTGSIQATGSIQTSIVMAFPATSSVQSFAIWSSPISQSFVSLPATTSISSSISGSK